MSTHESRISTVLPNYNHGRYLRRAVAAILRQVHLPCEIIIVDDGSTDDSLAIIDELARSSPLIRVLKKPTNEGAVHAQNLALASATGAYVHLAAADDVVLPGFYARALAMLRQYPRAGLFSGDSVLMDGTTSRLLGVRPTMMPALKPGYLSPERVRRALAHADNWILTGASIIRTNVLHECGGLHADLDSFADGYLTRKIALTHGYCYAPECVAVWNFFPSSFSHANALNANRSVAVRNAARACIASDPAFPHWYGERLVDRLRFSAARLALRETPIDAAKVIQLGARTGIDRVALTFALAVSKGRFGRIASMIWLYLQLRPFGLTRIAVSFIYRNLYCRVDSIHQKCLALLSE